jgi:nucleoside-diphosphate-sugar epimerase
MLPPTMTNQAGIQPGERVCVTGAAGFIGSHVVCTLLERGYRVRGTVRDPGNTGATAHLVRHAKSHSAELELVAADLTEPGAFESAVADCPYVCHVASSVRLTAPDPQREIVDVAVEGTRNVLGAIIEAGCARRVVITSSISAIVDETQPADYVHSESDWNRSASVEASPYPLSKTLAEQAAWAMVEQLPEDRRFALVTINPTWVLGPIMSKEHARSSPSVIRDLMTGKFPMVPNFYFGMVDVRDVALAHVRALEDPSAQGRHLLDCRGAWFIEIADEIRKAHPNLKAPRRRMPDALMYVTALFDKRLTWAFLRNNLSIARKLDGSRSRERLGMQFRPLDQTIRDTAQSIIDLGVL